MSKVFKMKGFEQNNGIAKLYDERVVFIPPNIITLLGSVFGQGSKSLLVFLGKKMGRKLAETWDDNFKPQTVKEFVEIFLEQASLVGWGQFKAVEIGDNKIIVRLYNNIAKDEDPPFHYICDFLTGYLAALGEYIMYNAQVHETACSIEDPDKDYCEFLIQKR